MKRFKIAGLALMVFCGALAIAGTSKLDRKMHQRLAFLTEKLDLSAEQQEQLKAITSEFHPQFEALREQEFEHPADKMEAAKSLKESAFETVRAILTPEQQVKFDALKAEREKRKGPPCGDRQTWKNEIEPVILEKRIAFDAQLSATEQATLAAVRSQMPERPKRENRGQAGERPSKEERQQRHQEMQSIVAPVKTIVDNHREALNAIQLEIKSLIKDKCGMTDGMNEARPERGPRKGRASDPEMRHMVRFLLLDPGTSTTGAGNADRTVRVYPNPASDNATFTYQVLSDGPVSVGLLNKDGQVVLQVFEGTQAAGAYEVNQPLGNLKTGEMYFFRVEDVAGSSTEKFMVLP
mgnify:CR=1 FL=1